MRRRVNPGRRVVINAPIFPLALFIQTLGQTETRRYLEVFPVKFLDVFKTKRRAHSAFGDLLLGLFPDGGCEGGVSLFCHELNSLNHSFGAFRET